MQTVDQHAFRAHPLDKPELVARILQAVGRGHTMVFCRTKRNAQKLADDLTDRGFAVGAVHGDLGQGAREQAMRAFRSGKVDVLVATDVAARGIDVEGITHVINYTCPEDEKMYVHRIGRTGRAGASGVAITFVDWEDVPRWNLIAKTLGVALEDPRETYSTSDHLYEELNIPREVSGRLPKSQRTRAGLGAEEVEDLGETGRKHGQVDKKRQGGGGHKHREERQGGHSDSKARPRKSKPKSDATMKSEPSTDGKAPTRRRRRRPSESGPSA